MTDIKIPAIDDPRTLRLVELDGMPYMLHVWDAQTRADTGQHQVGYAFYHVNEATPIFAGEDIGISPAHAIDSDAALRSIMGWLTLRKGDVDADFFADYTPRQLEFRDSSDCEFLQLWGMDDEDTEDSYAFVDLIDW